MTELPAQNVPSAASSPWWKLRAVWIYGAITAGELRDHDAKDDVRYAVLLEAVDRLVIPGGRVVATDPYVMEAEPEPFEQLLGADSADVIVARAVVGEGHERVAALILRVGSEPIADWVMATVAGQDVTTLDGEGFFGYGVDAGTGSFGSPEAMRVAGRVLHTDAGMLDDPMSRALFSDGIGTRSAVVVAPEAGATPVAVCSSGWGDGFYPTWLGLNSSGTAIVAVTDFLLTGDPHAAPPPERTGEAPAKTRPKSLLRRWFGG
ncbi:DUF4241 domain-containing protein [Actinopolymorpha sp. B9G3]|uniref:DUF4241 domain-containing protein n=1 Tax=Actinopolymorpha sp. B9G3 TaxID=3158970 RepID=UPI0032D95D4F